MSFSEHEKEFIKLKFDFEDMSDMKTLMDEEIYTFLKQKDRLKTVADNIRHFEATDYRPFSTIQVTKLLTKRTKSVEHLLQSLINFLTPTCHIFVDFHFLCESERKGETENESGQILDPFKLQTASKMSHLNDIIEIESESDKALLLKEFSNRSKSELLRDSFLNHSDLYEFSNSGLRPYALMSLVIHLTRFK